MWAGLILTRRSGSPSGPTESQTGLRLCLFVCLQSRSYEGGAPDAAAAVVAVGVAARQVGRGHEGVAVVGAAVLGQDVHALLTAGLTGVRHGAVPTGVPRRHVHAVLRRRRQVGSDPTDPAPPPQEDTLQRPRPPPSRQDGLPRRAAGRSPRVPCVRPGAGRCSRPRTSR